MFSRGPGGAMYVALAALDANPVMEWGCEAAVAGGLGRDLSLLLGLLSES